MDLWLFADARVLPARHQGPAAGESPFGQKTPAETLELQPGELVRVRSHDEILATLDTHNKNRGLFFDAEHVPYCNGTYRLLSRLKRIVDEKTGKMLEFKTASVILEGVACQARYSDRRLLCPRAICPYWREIWLERVNAETTDRPAARAEPTGRDARIPNRLTSPPR